MASISAYSVGRLAKYVAESSLKNLRANVYSCGYRTFSTEEKPAQSDAEKEKPATVEECHKLIDSLANELNTVKVQLKDYEDKYKRALADGENVRRRMLKQVEDAKSFAIQNFCKDLLDVAGKVQDQKSSIKAYRNVITFNAQRIDCLLTVADTLSAAAESVPASELSAAAGGETAAALKSLHAGVRLTSAQLTQVFTRHGLVSVSPLREKFDPNLHEALFQQEVEGAEAGTVVAVSKVGYKLHERCVRPALVGVAKGPSS